MIKLAKITFYLGVFAAGAVFLANTVFAQVVSPQGLDPSGTSTIRPPSSANVSGNIQFNSSSPNISQLNSLRAAGLPTNLRAATITVAEDGSAKIKNAVIFQIIGNTFFARTYWGEAFIRWTIRTDGKTQIVKRFNGPAKFSDLAVGHILNIDGSLLSGADTLNLNAVTIRDFSLENEDGTFSGRVTNVDSSTGNITIVTPAGINLTIKFDSGATIKKGAIYLQPMQIAVGDKILSVSGIYHEPSQSIEASNVEIYQDPSIFIPHNFQGKLKGLSGTTLPAAFTLVLTSKEYNMVMSDKTEVLNAKREPAKLQRFVEGDTIRVYGKIRETDLKTVDVEVVRNIDL